MDNAVNGGIIQELFAVPFASRNFREQLAIKNKGRPTPILDVVNQDGEKTRRIKKKAYTRWEWLTGCTVTNRLYCWPCILFPGVVTKSMNNIWRRSGYRDVRNLPRSANRHALSKTHISTTLMLKLLGAQAGERVKILEESHQQVTPPVDNTAIDVQVLEEQHNQMGSDVNAPAYNNIIQELFTNPFLNRNLQEQFAIKNQGRPTPHVKIIQIDNETTRCFNEKAFTRSEWLTACSVTKRLYCWPCILFPDNSESNLVWKRSGYVDLKNLPRACIRHAATREHKLATVRLKLLETQRTTKQITNRGSRNLLKEHCQQVNCNRHLLKKMIDITSLLSQHVQYLPKQEERANSSNCDHCKMFRVLTKYDEITKNSQSNVFCALENTLQHNLEQTMAGVIQQKISKETDKTNFFAWQIDETTDNAGKSLLSIIIRYVLEGKVVERFMGFFDVGVCSATGLQALLASEMKSFYVPDKLIAQSYDGAVIKASELTELRDKVKLDAPQALLIHSYAHNLNMVLSKSMKHIPQARIFFSQLSGFAVFFLKSSMRSEILDCVQAKRMPTKALTRWDLSSPPVTIVADIREVLIETFETIRDSNDSDEESVRESVFFLAFLHDINFMFLLYIFRKAFVETNAVCETLEIENTEVQICYQRIASAITSIMKLKNENEFNKLFHYVSNIFSVSKRSPMPGRAVHCCDCDYSKRLYFEIFDNIIQQLQFRFSDYRNLLFLPLLDVSSFSTHHNKFPDAAFQSLFSTYERFFDRCALRSELAVLYLNHELWQSCTSHSSLLEAFTKLNLAFTFPQVTKLLELIVTIPNTSSIMTHGVSCLKRIENFVRSSKNKEGQPSLALMNIERELLLELEQMPTWHDNVTDSFAKLTNCQSYFIHDT